MRKIGEKMISDFLSSGEEIGQAAQPPRWSATHTITHAHTHTGIHTHTYLLSLLSLYYTLSVL